MLNGEAVEVVLDIKVYPLATSNSQSILKTSQDKLDIYASRLRSKLGQDVVPSQIIDMLSDDGVWQVEVLSPAIPLIVNPWQWANCTDINLSLGRMQNG